MALLLLAGLATGCGGSNRRTEITRFPQWDYKSYERIAVLPFTSADRRGQRDAELMGETVSTLLAGNGSFTVVSREDLAAIMKEQDLSSLSDVSDSATAIAPGKIKSAQALVVGKLTDYELIAQRSEKRIPRYQRDRNGRMVRDRRGQAIVIGEDVIDQYRHAARVAGVVRVVDTATGKTLFAHACPAREDDSTRSGGPPSKTPEEIAAKLAEDVAREMYAAIAPIRIRVKLESDTLVVAGEYYEGEYDKLSTVPREMSRILVAVTNMPPECEGNPFRVAVCLKDGRENFAQHEFVWSGSLGRKGVSIEVPVKELIARATPENDRFMVKLYSGSDESPFMTREFSLAEAKE